MSDSRSSVQSADSPPAELTQILQRMERGDDKAADELLPLVYGQLRSLAAAKMVHERGDHTLQATALVHEAYVRLVGNASKPCFESESHFFAAAAESMRRILIDHARKRSAQKRGYGYNRVELQNCEAVQDGMYRSEDLLQIDDLLNKLRQEEPGVAELVSLRLFAGLSVAEAAKALGISRSAAYQDWDYALSWFAAESCE